LYVFQIADSLDDLRRFDSSGNNPEFSEPFNNPRMPVSQKVSVPKMGQRRIVMKSISQTFFQFESQSYF
jgi:hypothetical protein